MESQPSAATVRRSERANEDCLERAHAAAGSERQADAGHPTRGRELSWRPLATVARVIVFVIAFVIAAGMIGSGAKRCVNR